MRNLKQFGELHEAEVEKTKQGFVLVLKTWGRLECMTYMIVGVTETFQQFAEHFFEDNTGMIASEYMENDPGFGKNIETLMKAYSEAIDESNFEYQFWSGITPKPVKNWVYDAQDLMNPARCSVLLDKYFTDAKLVMTKFFQGNEEDMTYVAKSIDNDPSLLELYDDKEQEAIIKMLNWDERKKNAMLKYMRIKDQL